MEFPRKIQDAMIRDFLQDTPQAHEHIRYMPVPGRDEPQLYLSREGTRMLYRWYAQKGFTTREKAEQMIVAFETFLDSSPQEQQHTWQQMARQRRRRR